MLQVVYGQTKNRVVADKLVNAIQPIGLDGTLYIGYPVLAAAEEPVTIDALLLSKQQGLVAFIFEPNVPTPEASAAWDQLKNSQDRVYFAVTTHLSRHDNLRKG